MVKLKQYIVASTFSWFQHDFVGLNQFMSLLLIVKTKPFHFSVIFFSSTSQKLICYQYHQPWKNGKKKISLLTFTSWTKELSSITYVKLCLPSTRLKAFVQFCKFIIMIKFKVLEYVLQLLLIYIHKYVKCWLYSNV